MIEIENGIVRVSSSYGLKIAIDPANTFLGSQDKHASVSIEVPFEGAIEAAIETFDELSAKLDLAVKLAVYSQLNTQYTEVSEGVLIPVLAAKAQATAAAVAAVATPITAAPGYVAPAAPVAAPAAAAPQGQVRTPPKVDQSTLPTYQINIQGEMKAVKDCRAAKASGAYKPGAADFRSGRTSWWLIGKDGQPDPMGQYIAAQIAALGG